MKRKNGKLAKWIASVCMAATVALSLAACSQKTVSDPTEAIRNEYGNREFTIAFHTSGLDTPIEDIVYTANHMPVLPSPTRVGYVFAGWYLDSAYSTPYVDGILYLYMRDVTLYAKWVKEELNSRGVYDLEIAVTVLPETVSKGSMTDSAGGYKSLADCILYDEVCIENSDGHRYLKIPYDCGIVENMNDADTLPALRVSDSSKNTSAYLDSTKTIANYADSRKTVFLNIDDWNMETPLWPEVRTANREATDLIASERIATLTSYTAEITVSRFIGFTKPYADYTRPLEDGWYLAKSYYRSENNKPNMGSGFNPVYSYLRAENGRYTLVKEFTPYLGMLGTSNTLLDPITANYYNRMTSFAPIQLSYDMDASAFGDGEVTSDYYPATYGGTTYGTYVAEFHADTGKYYSVYDLGTDLTRERMIMGGITGFMEAASGMGAANQILSIDYRHLIKLSDEEVAKDYTPLTESGEDGYAYAEEMQYYPGNEADLTERNLVYAALKETGMGTHLINFFFSAQSLSVPYTGRRVYSSRITVTPTGETAATPVSEARYSIAHFRVGAVVYGYKESDGNLYADSLTLQSLGSHAMRETLCIRTGKSLNAGDAVSLESLYAEKVDPTGSFSEVSVHAYRLTNGAVNEAAAASLPSRFSYGGSYTNLAVVFARKTAAGGTLRTTVYLTDRTEPTIRRVTDYDENAEHAVGDVVKIPDVRYTWDGQDGNFIENYFANEEGLKGIHIIRAVKFSVQSGVYAPTFFECVVTPTSTMNIIEKDTRVLYELQNPYGERYYYELVYRSDSAKQYVISDSAGNVLEQRDITYDENGKRAALDREFSFYDPAPSTVLAELSRRLTLTVDGSATDLGLVSYTLCTDRVTETDIPADNIAALTAHFREEMDAGSYFYVSLTYQSGDDRVVRKFLCKVTFGGKRSAELLDYEAYFIGKKYVAPCNDIYASDGTKLGSASFFMLQAYKGDTLRNNIISARYARCETDGYNVRLTFNTAGRYRLSYAYRLTGLGGENTDFSFVQYFDVLSDKSDVHILFVTDEEHPFADGTLQKRVTYTLGGEMATLLQRENFLPTDSVLFGWATDRRLRPALATLPGGEFENYGNYNTTELSLYAVWDDGIRVTTEINGVRKTYDTVYYRATTTDKDSGTEMGAYCIDLSAFIPQPPTDGDASSYTFVGWTGGFLGTAVRTDKVYLRGAELTEEELVIRPVYRRTVRMVFTQPKQYAAGTYVLGSASVPEGELLQNPGYYLRIRGAAGYTFLGWAVLVDGAPVMVDLTKPIDGTLADPETYMLTLVAIFADSEGNQVW